MFGSASHLADRWTFGWVKKLCIKKKSCDREEENLGNCV